MPPAREYITIEEEESQAMLMRADDAREEVGMFELEDDAPDMAQGTGFEPTPLDAASEMRAFELIDESDDDTDGTIVRDPDAAEADPDAAETDPDAAEADPGAAQADTDEEPDTDVDEEAEKEELDPVHFVKGKSKQRIAAWQKAKVVDYLKSIPANEKMKVRWLRHQVNNDKSLTKHEKPLQIYALSQVRRWAKKLADQNTSYKRMSVQLRTKGGKGRYPLFETYLEGVISGRVDGGSKTTMAFVIKTAEEWIAAQPKSASIPSRVHYGLIERFLKRRGFKLGRVKRVTPETPDAIRAKLVAWFQELAVVHKTFPIKLIFNFDEIPIALSGGCSRSKNIFRKGDEAHHVRGYANDHKRCATLMATYCAKLLPDGASETIPVLPFLIHKLDAKTDRIRQEGGHPQVKVAYCPSGMMSGAIFVDEFLPLLIGTCRAQGIVPQQSLLIFDHAGAHTSTMDSLVATGFRTMIMPKHCTSFVQFVDTHAAAKLKTYIRALYDKNIYEKDEPLTAAQKRKFMVFFYGEAYHRTLNVVVNPALHFADLGYVNVTTRSERVGMMNGVPLEVPALTDAEEAVIRARILKAHKYEEQTPDVKAEAPARRPRAPQQMTMTPTLGLRRPTPLKM